MMLSFMASSEPELRAAACQIITFVAKNMVDAEQKAKLIPAIKKLAQDTVEFVKIELSKNIVSLCSFVSV